MTFELVLEKNNVIGHKQIGEDVYLSQLSSAFPCYVFYYPGQLAAPALEEALRVLGKTTGSNLFVNIGSFRDPQYTKIAALFEVRRNPVIIVTAIGSLASPANGSVTSYVRLDEPRLLASPERTIECVQELFNLFHRGEIAKAIGAAKSAERSELLRALGQCVGSSLRFLWDFVSERDISVSVAEGRFELKRSTS